MADDANDDPDDDDDGYLADHPIGGAPGPGDFGYVSDEDDDDEPPALIDRHNDDDDVSVASSVDEDDAADDDSRDEDDAADDSEPAMKMMLRTIFPAKRMNTHPIEVETVLDDDDDDVSVYSVESESKPPKIGGTQEWTSSTGVASTGVGDLPNRVTRPDPRSTPKWTRNMEPVNTITTFALERSEATLTCST
jgi:hypothetical protein